MPDRYCVSTATYLLLERENPSGGAKEILLLRRYHTGYHDGDYSLIAGHLDPDESLKQAMSREAKEEASIQVDPSNLEHVHTMHTRTEISGDLTDERLDFYFRATIFNGEPQIMEPDKCDDMGWFPDDRLPGNIIPKVIQAIQSIRAGETFSELGW